MKTFRVLLAISLFSIWSPSVAAEWVTATGSALIVNDQQEKARQEALDDAVRQAALQFGADVTSDSHMVNGRVIEDSVKLSTRATARKVQVVDEQVAGDRVLVTVSADMVLPSRCPDSSAQRYLKRVALVGFSQADARTASLGDLGDVDRELPEQMARRLQGNPYMNVLVATQYQLFPDVATAPTRETDDRRLTRAVNVATKLDAQMVVSGVIRDMSVRAEDTYDTTRASKFLRTFGWPDNHRHFDVDLYVHDGFSGALIHQQRFSTTGVWNLEPTEETGFGTPAFWETPYGAEVGAQMERMVASLSEVVQCQPFMTRITRIDGKSLFFRAGSESGVRPGDKFGVYRTFMFYQSDMLNYTELTNTRAALKVSQVHPGFGSGTLMVDAGRLNIQRDDLLVVW